MSTDSAISARSGTIPWSNDAIATRLAEPFSADDIQCRPGTVSGNRALVLWYADARAVMDRLDAVIGAANWQDAYTPLPDGNVVCRLSLRIGGEWIAKEDVGGESEQKDEGDRRKAAFSDALKRAAVKWGIGRFLYSLPAIWCDYDPAKRQFTKRPQLPADLGKPTPPPKAAPQPAAPKANGTATATLPANGAELLARLSKLDATLVREGLANPNEVLQEVRAAVEMAHPKCGKVEQWDAAAVEVGFNRARAFAARRNTEGSKRPPATEIGAFEMDLKQGVGAGPVPLGELAIACGMNAGTTLNDLTVADLRRLRTRLHGMTTASQETSF